MVLQLNAASASYLDKQLNETKNNAKYNNVQKYKRSYDDVEIMSKKVANLKDPGLIKLSEYKEIKDSDYKKKLSQDEAMYNSKVVPALKKDMKSLNVEPAAVDFYNVYRISERVIRANNLDYTNWRISIRKSEDINAASFDGNCVWIYTGLYDSLYTDDDALAFVIAHEMAHQIMGHNQRLAQLKKKLKRLDMIDASNARQSDSQRLTGGYVTALNRKAIYHEFKKMEFSADSEALILLTKAGYSPEKALDALNLLDATPNVRYFLMSHPLANERIENAKENIALLDSNWEKVGIQNIYESDVLNCKKSSDRVSIVISKSEKAKDFYQPETFEQRVTRFAYESYLHGNMEDAIKFFSKMPEGYVPYLYISYANEYLYKQTGLDKYLKQAIKSVEKAKELRPADTNVQTQYKELQSL